MSVYPRFVRRSFSSFFYINWSFFFFCSQSEGQTRRPVLCRGFLDEMSRLCCSERPNFIASIEGAWNSSWFIARRVAIRLSHIITHGCMVVVVTAHTSAVVVIVIGVLLFLLLCPSKATSITECLGSTGTFSPFGGVERTCFSILVSNLKSHRDSRKSYSGREGREVGG